MPGFSATQIWKDPCLQLPDQLQFQFLEYQHAERGRKLIKIIQKIMLLPRHQMTWLLNSRIWFWYLRINKLKKTVISEIKTASGMSLIRQISIFWIFLDSSYVLHQRKFLSEWMKFFVTNHFHIFFWACSELAIFMYWTRNSMNNLSSYIGLIQK